MTYIRNKYKIEADQPWKNSLIDPYICIKNVYLDRNGGQVLKGINISVYKNEFFCILGESGCGKTTLLRLIAGFEKSTSGGVFIDDVDMTHVPPYERPVNMMFQSYALFPHFTVRENIAFGLKQDRYSEIDIDERVESVLKIVRLEKYIDKNVQDLSGGEKQRIALARCIAKRPKVICLDEPLGALDKSLRDDMQFELVRIQEEVGITFIMVTHDQEEAMTVSSRMGIMENGVMRQIGTPGEIYEYPNCTYVADFIGFINFFEGVVVDAQHDYIVVHSVEIDCELKVSCSYSVPVGSSIVVGVRPEKINLFPAGDVGFIESPTDSKYENYSFGKVVDIGYLGDVSMYRILLQSKFNAGKIVVVTQQNHFRIAERAITWDDEVLIKWSEKNSLIFNS